MSLRGYLSFYVLAVLLAGLGWRGEARSMQTSRLHNDAVVMVTRALEDPHAHAHEDDHAEEATCSINSRLLAEAFNEVAKEMNLTGLDGLVCSVPVPECHPHGDDEHAHEEEEGEHDHEEEEEGEHHHEEEEDEDGHEEEEEEGDHHEGEEHDDEHGSGSNATDSQCLSVFSVCQELLLHTNLTTLTCLSSECEEDSTETSSSSRTGKAEAYGYGFLMVVLVCLGSLLGVLIVPLIDKDKDKKEKQSKRTTVYKYLYFFMIALGTSALLCDAILHLIPHAWELHDHEDEADAGGHAHDHAHGKGVEDFLWKGSVSILAIYLFYLLEYILHSWSSHSHSHGFPINDETIPLDVTVPHSPCKASSHDGHVVHPGTKDAPESPASTPPAQLSTQDLTTSEAGKERLEKRLAKKALGWVLHIKPLAWLIIIGDGFHNFADGLALGAAISQSLALGISTMIALLFHEIPHEFGDYVILLSTGLSWYSALLFNFMSALTAIIGFFIGVAIGTESEEVNAWILAFAAGLFIYIALVDLLPELIHSKERGYHRWGLFCAANIGFFVSFIVLFIIAVYEEDLNNLVSE